MGEIDPQNDDTILHSDGTFTTDDSFNRNDFPFVCKRKGEKPCEILDIGMYCTFFHQSGDYIKLDKYGFAIKYHRLNVLSNHAQPNLRCLGEGAQLYYPNNKAEGDYVFSAIGDDSVEELYVGIQRFPQKNFTTVEG
jgi:hypothetical protein